MIATLGGLAYSIMTAIISRDPNAVSHSLMAFAWPPLLHVAYLSAVNNWVPVAYLLRPPRYPARTSQSVSTEDDVLVESSI